MTSRKPVDDRAVEVTKQVRHHRACITTFGVPTLGKLSADNRRRPSYQPGVYQLGEHPVYAVGALGDIFE